MRSFAPLPWGRALRRSRASATMFGAAVSGVVGIVRDVAVVAALGVSATSDHYFASFLAFNTVYVFFIGGTLLPSEQISWASDRPITRTSAFLRREVARSTITALIAGAAVGSFYGTTMLGVVIGVIAFLCTLMRTAAELEVLRGQSAGEFFVTGVVPSVQNLAILVFAIVAWRLSIPRSTGSLVLWVGVLAGYLLQAGLMLRAPHRRVPAVQVSATAEAGPRERSHRSLFAGLLATDATKLVETIVLTSLGSGLATAVLVLKRISGAAALLLTPSANGVVTATRRDYSDRNHYLEDVRSLLASTVAAMFALTVPTLVASTIAAKAYLATGGAVGAATCVLGGVVCAVWFAVALRMTIVSGATSLAMRASVLGLVGQATMLLLLATTGRVEFALASAMGLLPAAVLVTTTTWWEYDAGRSATVFAAGCLSLAGLGLVQFANSGLTVVPLAAAAACALGGARYLVRAVAARPSWL